MHGGLKTLIGVYMVVGAAYAIDWLNAAFLRGGHRNTAGIGYAVFFLAMAFGLGRRHRWGRVLGLFGAACLMILGLGGVALGFAAIMGKTRGASGLLVTRPVLGMTIFVLVFAFGALQLWILTRPELNAWFGSRPRPGA